MPKRKSATTDPKQPPLTDAERHERFVETVRKVDADEDTEAFDRAFASVVKPAKPGKGE